MGTRLASGLGRACQKYIFVPYRELAYVRWARRCAAGVDAGVGAWCVVDVVVCGRVAGCVEVSGVRKGALSPSIECGQPQIEQKNSEFMVVKRCRGLVSWFRFHKPLGDQWEE